MGAPQGQAPDVGFELLENQCVLLLLFGLDKDLKDAYRKSINRIFREYPELFLNRQLVLKPHPINSDNLLIELVEELTQDLSITVTLFDCRVNLDILWSLIPADIVLAGPCGALPIIKRFGVSKPFVLNEVMDEYLSHYPSDGWEAKTSWELVQGINII